MKRAFCWLLVAALSGQAACNKPVVSTASSGPLAVVRAHIEAENAHNVDRILATLADTIELHIRSSTQRDSVLLLDLAAQRLTYQRAVTAMPQSHFTALEQIVSGPFVVSREEMRDGVTGGVEVGLAMYRIVGDRIAALWIINTEGTSDEAVPPAG